VRLTAYIRRESHSRRAGRHGEPEEIAAAALCPASDDSAWMIAHPLPIDGGLSA